MTKISYHISHEQFSPSRLLGLVVRAENAGFSGALSSDHFHPWSETQGESGFAWSWLGAAMARTSFTFGIVNAPGSGITLQLLHRLLPPWPRCSLNGSGWQ